MVSHQVQLTAPGAAFVVSGSVLLLASSPLNLDLTAFPCCRSRSIMVALPSLDQDVTSSALKDSRRLLETTRTNPLKLLPVSKSPRRRHLLATSHSRLSSTLKLLHLRPMSLLRVKLNPIRKMRRISLVKELSKAIQRTTKLPVRNRRRLENSSRTKVEQ